MSMVEFYFAHTQTALDAAKVQLEYLAIVYEKSALDSQTKRARVAALKGKIGVINSIKLDPAAHPWSEDKL